MEREELLEKNKILFNDKRQGFILVYDTGWSQHSVAARPCNRDKPVGVAHVALRSDYVNGIESDGDFGYLEAVYVKPDYRMNGIAVALVRLCEEWAKKRGCREMVSDCLLHNTDSYLFHLRIGFSETERCIFFRKEL
jgi:aminoglycoside 6'-N-acetyltransferase I